MEISGNIIVSGVHSRYIRIFITLCVTLLAMLLFSPLTSPLFPMYFGDETDSALFLLIGKGITQGKTCYSELFDHKGPIMFLIQALGYTLGGKTGVWLLQCLSAMVTFTLAYETASLLRARFRVFPLIIGGMYFLALLTQGNLTEEFSMPFIMLCLYLALRWLKSGKTRHPVQYAFVYGVSFALLCLMKITNAITVVFIVLWVLFSLVRSKEYKNIANSLGSGALGVLSVTAPIFAWFYAQGALGDMLYATFIHNFYYAQINAHLSFFSVYIFQHILTYLPIVLSLGIVIKAYSRTKRKEHLFIVWIVAANLVSLLYVNRYTHYFLIFVPVFMMALGALDDGSILALRKGGFLRAAFAERNPGLISARREKRFSFQNLEAVTLAAVAVICIWTALVPPGITWGRYFLTGEILQKNRSIAQDASLIPADEQGSVIGYMIPSSYYLEADITPSYKYFTFQEWYSLSNPRILDDFIRYVDGETPLWVITRPAEDNEMLLGVLDRRYDLAKAGEYVSLYRLREQEHVIIRPTEPQKVRNEYLR